MKFRGLSLPVLLCLGASFARAWIYDPSKPLIYEMRIAFETDKWINMYSTATVLSKSDNSVAFCVVKNSTTTPDYQLVVTTQGKVGIGTVAPAAALDVNGQIWTTGAGNARASLYDLAANAVGAGSSIYSYGYICAGNGSGNCSLTGGVTISAGVMTGSPAVAIAGSGSSYFNAGNVGIGTTNPTAMLGIKNSSNRAVDIYTPGTANGTGSNIIWTTDTNGSKQDIAYFGAVQDGDNTQSGKFYWQVGNAGTPGVVMTLNKSGNLGIGTMAPAHRLHLSGGAYCDGTGGWVAGSDRAYKKDIDYGFKYGLREIEKLKPVYYVHKQDAENRKQIGFIAQDVEKVVPEIVGGSEGSLGLSYERLTAVLVKAVQELELRVDSQRAEIESLKARLREVEKK